MKMKNNFLLQNVLDLAKCLPFTRSIKNVKVSDKLQRSFLRQLWNKSLIWKIYFSFSKLNMVIHINRSFVRKKKKNILSQKHFIFKFLFCLSFIYFVAFFLLMVVSFRFLLHFTFVYRYYKGQMCLCVTLTSLYKW